MNYFILIVAILQLLGSMYSFMDGDWRFGVVWFCIGITNLMMFFIEAKV